MNVEEAIRERRAFRSLESIEITDDLIVNLAKVAQIDPSYANKQPWNFFFAKEKEQ
jgi:nitroreductase